MKFWSRALQNFWISAHSDYPVSKSEKAAVELL
jgi:hypothetical protein